MKKFNFNKTKLKDSKELKKQKAGIILKSESKVIAYVVICLVVAVIGMSYAYFFSLQKGTTEVVTAGTLTFTYTNGSTISNADCFIPSTQAEATAKTACAYPVTITNTGSLASTYKLTISSNTGASPALEASKIQVILKKGGSIVTGYPKALSAISGGVLATDTLAKTNGSVSYSVQVYVPDTIAAADSDDTIILKINGSGEVSSSQALKS